MSTLDQTKSIKDGKIPGAYPAFFFPSGFIFDINKVEPQDGTQHEKKKLENYVDSPAYSRLGRYAPGYKVESPDIYIYIYIRTMYLYV